MKSKLKKLSDSRVEITVTLDADDLKAATKKALEKLAKEVKVEGFRKGKVPAEVAKKFIPENDIHAEAVDIAVRLSVFDAFREQERFPLDTPSVSVTKYIPDEMAEYTATVDIIPEVKLCDYKKLGVKYTPTKVEKKDIDRMLDNIANSFAEKKVVRRAAKLTDEVIIDFVGKKDGEAFRGGSAKDYRLTLGSKSFIPGFEEGIVGHEAGDSFELKLTFPEDYGVKELAGAETVFEVLLKQVNEVTKAEINDELAKKCGPFEDLAELKADIKKNLATQTEQTELGRYKDELVRALVEKSKVPAPEILIKDQMNLIREDLERNAERVGMSIEEYLKNSGEDPEKWEEEAKKVAEQRVKASLALQYLAREEKITVPEEAVDEKIAELREIYKKSPEVRKSLKDPKVRIEIKNRLIIEKTLDYLVKNNKS
ncbi:MAG: trigger factor [Candidatus Saccharibacteria bacterium]|nr:trigger factor [Candidatus Saccharibacteria bacterium]